MKVILIVEDDYLQAEWLKEILQEHFSKDFPDLRVRQISTESDFWTQIETLRKNPPDLVLLDIMLRWKDPTPTRRGIPIEVEKNGFFRAGLRCERLLRKYKETKHVPVIFYTVLQESDLGDELIKAPPTYYVGKASDTNHLIETIKKATRHHG